MTEHDKARAALDKAQRPLLRIAAETHDDQLYDVVNKALHAIGQAQGAINRLQSEAAKPPKMKKVRNLMTGEEIEIPEDTPRACDPSSELYWTM